MCKKYLLHWNCISISSQTLFSLVEMYILNDAALLLFELK